MLPPEDHKRSGKQPVSLGDVLTRAIRPAEKAARSVEKKQPARRQTPVRPAPRSDLSRALTNAVRPAVHAGVVAKHTGPQKGLGAAAIRDAVEAAHSAASPTYRELQAARAVRALAVHKLFPGVTHDRKAGGGLLASANVTGLADATGKAFAKGLPGVAALNGIAGSVPKPLGDLIRLDKKIVTNAGKDAIEIPAEAVPALYHTFKPLAHGDVKQTAKLLVGPYVQTAKHPLKSFVDHPLGTALLAEGVRGGAGRTAGRTARSGVLGKSAREYASLERPSAVLPSSSLVEKRAYSKDLMVARTQRAVDRRNVRKATALRKQADEAEAHARADPEGSDVTLEHAQQLRARANRVDPRIVTEKQLARRVDENRDAAEGVRRLHRTQATNAAVKAVGKKPAATVRLLAEGTIKATPEDLSAYISELGTEFRRMDADHPAGRADASIKSKMRANEQLRKSLMGDLEKVRSGKLSMDDMLAKARAFSEARNKLDEPLAAAQVLDRAQAARRTLLPAAVRNLGLKIDEETGNFVDRSGNPVSTPDIARALKDPRRVGNPAFLSQAPNARGAGNFFRSSSRPAQIPSRKFQGTATKEGTYSADGEVFRESMGRAQTLVDQQAGFKDFLNEFAARHTQAKGGRIVQKGTYGRAAEEAKRLNEAGSPVEWVPVRSNPLGGRGEQMQQLVEDAKGETQSHPTSAAIQEALDGKVPADTQGTWTLVPRPVLERQAQHEKLLGPDALPRVWNQASQGFRRVVLATNPNWLWMNQLEAGFRTTVEGAPPFVSRSYYRGRKLIKELEKVSPSAREEFMERGIGQGHYGFAERSKIHRPLRGDGGTVSRAAAAIAHTKAVEKASKGWDRYTHTVFEDVNGRMERQFRVALAGKYATDHLLPKNGLRLSRDAYEQAAKGLTNTHEQVALGRYIDTAYGKYGKFSPKQRQFLQLYTPFGAWTLNAVKFLTAVLPRDHPVLTAVITASSQSSADWRKSHGLSEFAAGRAPGFLQGTIPTPDGGHIRAPAKGTPFGLAADFPDNLASAFLPQVSGTLSALQGRDFTGNEMRDKKGEPLDPLAKLGAALKETAGAQVPLYGTVDRFLGGDSTGEALNKLFNPAYVTKSKNAAQQSGKGGKVRRPRRTEEDEIYDALSQAQAAGPSDAELDEIYKALQQP